MYLSVWFIMHSKRMRKNALQFFSLLLCTSKALSSAGKNTPEYVWSSDSELKKSENQKSCYFIPLYHLYVSWKLHYYFYYYYSINPDNTIYTFIRFFLRILWCCMHVCASIFPNPIWIPSFCLSVCLYVCLLIATVFLQFGFLCSWLYCFR